MNIYKDYPISCAFVKFNPALENISSSILKESLYKVKRKKKLLRKQMFIRLYYKVHWLFSGAALYAKVRSDLLEEKYR